MNPYPPAGGRTALPAELPEAGPPPAVETPPHRWARPRSALRFLWGRPPQTVREAVRAGPGWHWLLPTLFMVASLVPWYLYRRAYWWIMKEDYLAEWGTAFAYVATMVLAALIARRLWRSDLRVQALLYAAGTVAFFGIAGEEISWGQRLFGFAGPDTLVTANQQHEANLHNLLSTYPLEGAYIVLGVLGAFGLRWLVPRIPRLRDRAWLFAPPAQLAPWFVPVIVYYGWTGYIDPIVERVADQRFTLGTFDRLQEVAELSLACGFLLFVVAVLLRLRAGGLDQPDLLDTIAD